MQHDTNREAPFTISSGWLHICTTACGSVVRILHCSWKDTDAHTSTPQAAAVSAAVQKPDECPMCVGLSLLKAQPDESRS